MAADIFNRTTDAFGGSFSADGAFLTFASPGIAAGSGLVGSRIGVGLLTQNLTIGYQQNVLRLYEIGTNLHFFVAGRTSGQLSVGRVLGPRPISIAFYKKFGDVCNAGTNLIDLVLATGCNSPGNFQTAGAVFTIRLLFCIITNISVTMNAQDSLISEQLQMMFCSMLMTDAAADAAAGAAAVAGGAAAAVVAAPPAGGLPTVSELDFTVRVSGELVLRASALGAGQRNRTDYLIVSVQPGVDATLVNKLWSPVDNAITNLAGDVVANVTSA